jgi:hypothetical protein
MCHVPDLAQVDANPSASQQPKQTIKPKLQADQADISDKDCANSDCQDPKVSGEMIRCAVSCYPVVVT